MKVAIGKFGKSILFNKNSWGAVGGECEPPELYEMLFHKNPDIDFYIVGCSDFSFVDEATRRRVNKNNNVYDVWDGFREWRKTYEGEEAAMRTTFLESVWDKYKDADCGLFFAGSTGAANVYGKVTRKDDPTKLVKTLMAFANYAGPMIHYINETKLPYNLIVNDPRLYPDPIRDLMVPPINIFSQYDETITHKTWKAYNDRTPREYPVEAKYSGVETCFMLSREKGGAQKETVADLSALFETKEEPKEQTKFMIVLNEGSPSRYDDLKKYVLDHVEDVEIYGKWKADTIGDDKRFVGSVPFVELQKMLPDVKYSFCIPIKKGWVTAKFWELAHNGVIPFMHPTYDEQNHLGAPDFLKVKDAADLHKKIQYLEDNPAHYEKLKKLLDDMLKEEYYNGDFLNDKIISSLKEICEEGSNKSAEA